MANNPFTAVWDGLWTMASRNTSLMALVRKSNRIKYDKANGPKRTISEGDLPELQLLSSGVNSNIRNTSGTSRVNRQYTWGIVTGEYEINMFYNDVCWELYRSMIDWDVTLCALTWPVGSDWHYVVRANVNSADEGTFMMDENRGIMGWAGMWQVEVEMHFNTDNLRIT